MDAEPIDAGSPELEALRAEASVGDADLSAGGGQAPGAGAAPGAAPQSATESPEEWRDALKFTASIVCEAYPQLRPVYTDEKISELGTRLHAVAAKHGWSMGAWFTKWREEIAFGMVALPMLRDTARALKSEPAGARARTGAAEPPPPAGDAEPAQVVAGVIRPNTGADLT